MTKRYTKLWSVVKDIIKERHELFEKEYIRDVYYMIGDILGPLIGSKITQEDYDWYGTRQGYATLRDDVWPLMEQRHGFKRPHAWPVGLVFDEGLERPLSKLLENADLGLDYIWDQARGFIFVEKRGEAVKLKELSNYGWTICAGTGYPERLMRRLLKEEKKERPVLVLHDWDEDGKGIYQALGFKTRRTKHLDLALGDRVVDLGLNKEVVERLKLPTRPSPPKYKGKPRVEISGLAVLKMRMEIENPTLAYVVAAILARGLKLSPTELSKKELAERHMRWLLSEGLKPVINSAIEWTMKQQELEGNAVEAVLTEKMYSVPGLREKLIEVAMQFLEKIDWRGEDYYHKEALERFTDERLIQLLKD